MLRRFPAASARSMCDHRLRFRPIWLAHDSELRDGSTSPSLGSNENCLPSGASRGIAPASRLSRPAQACPQASFNFPNIGRQIYRNASASETASRRFPFALHYLITAKAARVKELIAKAIHSAFHARDKAFVPVNTGSIPLSPGVPVFRPCEGRLHHAVASTKGFFDRPQAPFSSNESATIAPKRRPSFLACFRSANSGVSVASPSTQLTCASYRFERLLLPSFARAASAKICFALNVIHLQDSALRDAAKMCPSLGAFRTAIARKL